MTWPDIVNAFFEFGASVAILNHCRVLCRVKRVSGVSVLSIAFFASWGVWNLYYYPSLGQVASLVAGVGVVTANLLFLALLLRYRK